MKTEDVLFWAILMITILLFLWFFLGNSPTLEQILLVALVGLIVKLQGDMKEIKGDYKEFKRNVIKSFENLKKRKDYK